MVGDLHAHTYAALIYITMHQTYVYNIFIHSLQYLSAYQYEFEFMC